MKKRILALLLCLCCLFGVTPGVYADEPETGTAQDITADTDFSGTGYDSFKFLRDGSITSYKKSSGDAHITLENESGIASLYILFNLEYGSYTITDNTSGSTLTAGEYGFLHEYIDLYAAWGTKPTSITIDFENGTVRLSEIFTFSEGTPPDFVQIWEKPLDNGADILLLSTHGDDDQLFFAGLLPLYAAEKGLRVQVAYMTDHRNLTYARTHEMLNGLWAVGVKTYPVFGDFTDFLIESLKGTYNQYASEGVTKEELVGFVVEQLRRFKPQVVVGHDINGEYGHGMHMVYTDCLIAALDITADPEAYPETAEKYGVWDVPKTYIHLYEENPIVMDYDQPLQSFDGMTAFEVSQKLGYPCHESQQYTWFTKWINGKTTKITKASQIETYNPCNFGLYRSTVGEDVLKNDFMENITPYAELERIEAEKKAEEERLAEEQRKKEEEERRKEEERLAQEREQARLEAEKQAEEARKQQEALEKEQQQEKRLLTIACAVLGVLVLILVIVLLRLRAEKKRRQRRRKRPTFHHE